MTTYQDFDFIATMVSRRVEPANSRNDDVLTHSAWNILRAIDCQDATTFETIISGICNAFNAGYDDCEFVYYRENDSWND